MFASIGLLVDFYLQMVFFATILSIDIRRLELSDLDRGHAYLHVQVSELVGCVGECSTIHFSKLTDVPSEWLHGMILTVYFLAF